MALCSNAQAEVYSSRPREESASMPDVTVEVRRDHLERLAVAHPIEGITELIWNALDSDATKVIVSLILNELGGVEAARVLDNGGGIPYSEAESAFRNLSTKCFPI